MRERGKSENNFEMIFIQRESILRKSALFICKNTRSIFLLENLYAFAFRAKKTEWKRHDTTDAFSRTFLILRARELMLRHGLFNR